LQLFLVYLYGMSSLFILFVEIYLIQQKGQEKADKDKPQILVKDRKTDTHNIYDTTNGSECNLKNSPSYPA
jgi:hypothetical protein